MADWFEATTWSITRVSATEISERFVLVDYGGGITRRRAKDSALNWIRPTFKEAKNCLIAYHNDVVAECEQRLHDARESLANAYAMPEPADPASQPKEHSDA